MQVATYSPRVFDVSTIQDAKNIILTPEIGLSTDERWERETPHLLGLIDRMQITMNSVVLDYGCGIGRLSKAMIQRYGCRVVGVDISASMRALAAVHVESDRFFACHPDMVALMGVKCDAAVTVWAAQHFLNPTYEFTRIAGCVRERGPLFVVNENIRVVPTDQGWINDGVLIRDVIGEHFALEIDGKMDPDIVTEAVSDRTFWAIYRKRTGDER